VRPDQRQPPRQCSPFIGCDKREEEDRLQPESERADSGIPAAFRAAGSHRPADRACRRHRCGESRIRPRASRQRRGLSWCDETEWMPRTAVDFLAGAGGKHGERREGILGALAVAMSPPRPGSRPCPPTPLPDFEAAGDRLDKQSRAIRDRVTVEYSRLIPGSNPLGRRSGV
jgi:hypothetical protein